MINNSKIHLPGINGLRTISAFAVLFSHITLSLNLFGLDRNLFGIGDDGFPVTTLLSGFGVTIFFTISGFLITYLLLLEKQESSINVGKFYMRRILRIWPLYYSYILLVLIVYLASSYDIDWKGLFYFLFLIPNVNFSFGNSFYLLDHYWSLGVEEQFYLLWPLIVLHSRSLLKFIFTSLFVLLSIKLICRWIEYRHGITQPYNFVYITRYQCMLLGGLGGYLYYTQRELLNVLKSFYIQLMCWLIIFLLAVNLFHIFSIIDHEFISVVVVAIIVGQVSGPHKIINLENRFFDFLGKLTFGIYVIHPLIIYLFSLIFKSNNLPEETWSYYFVFFSITILTIFISYISYRYLEKPFLKIKEKFTIIKSSPTILK